MIKFIKEIFSAENLKKAMVYSSFMNPKLTASDYLHLNNILRDMNSK